tara:strand:- start:736 stop:1413 length:678 start_codon:yes stop_codon:yes gene_type:complete
MKLLVENWRQYLNENEQQFQIYCDMDGVLVDFMKAAVETINNDVADMSIPSHKETGGITTLGRVRRALEQEGRSFITREDIETKKNQTKVQKTANSYMYRRVEDDFDWWAKLEWMPDGKELWDHIKVLNPYILTSPMKQEGSREGKRAWVAKNLKLPNGGQPEKVILNSKKYLYANVGSTKNILIDDMTKNTIPWNEVSKDTGSVAILHTSTADTIRQLDKILRK